MRLLFLAGSPRPDSRSRTLLQHAIDHVTRMPSPPAVDLIDLAVEPADPFRGWEAEYGETTHALVHRMQVADALLIASPVFNGGYSAALKNLFEHIHHKSLRGKTAGCLLAASGMISFLQVRSHLEQLLYYFQVRTLPRAVFARAADLREGIPPEIAARIENLTDALLEAAGWSAGPAHG